jgi:hypothetical protein
MVLYFFVDSVVSGDSYDCGAVDSTGAEAKADVGTGTGAITVGLGYVTSGQDTNSLEDFRYFIRDNPAHAPAAESTKIYAMGIKYSFIIGENLAKPALGSGNYIRRAAGNRGVR